MQAISSNTFRFPSELNEFLCLLVCHFAKNLTTCTLSLAGSCIQSLSQGNLCSFLKVFSKTAVTSAQKSIWNEQASYLTVNPYLLCYTSNNLKFCMNPLHTAQSHNSHQKQWIAILIVEHNFYIYCCDILYCKSFIYFNCGFVL